MNADAIDAGRLTLALNDLRLPTIKTIWRIASPEMLPKPRLLPHLKCSPGEGLGDEYEEGEHGDTPGIGAGDH
jgi:hypothetical protein